MNNYSVNPTISWKRKREKYLPEPVGGAGEALGSGSCVIDL